MVITFTYSADRLVVLGALKDTLLNASDANKDYIVDSCFIYSSDKQKAHELLKNISSRFFVVVKSPVDEDGPKTHRVRVRGCAPGTACLVR